MPTPRTVDTVMLVVLLVWAAQPMAMMVSGLVGLLRQPTYARGRCTIEILMGIFITAVIVSLALPLIKRVGAIPILTGLGLCTGVGALATGRMLRDRRRERMDHWKRLGLCMMCGYDLRASADRCPECGAAIAINQAPYLSRVRDGQGDKAV